MPADGPHVGFTFYGLYHCQRCGLVAVPRTWQRCTDNSSSFIVSLELHGQLYEDLSAKIFLAVLW